MNPIYVKLINTEECNVKKHTIEHVSFKFEISIDDIKFKTDISRSNFVFINAGYRLYKDIECLVLFEENEFNRYTVKNGKIVFEACVDIFFNEDIVIDKESFELCGYYFTDPNSRFDEKHTYECGKITYDGFEFNIIVREVGDTHMFIKPIDALEKFFLKNFIDSCKMEKNHD